LAFASATGLNPAVSGKKGNGRVIGIDLACDDRDAFSETSAPQRPTVPGSYKKSLRFRPERPAIHCLQTKSSQQPFIGFEQAETPLVEDEWQWTRIR
jgi:hypothetical protein